MKKKGMTVINFLFAVCIMGILTFAVLSSPKSVYPASAKQYEYFIVNGTGTYGFSFSKTSTEIHIVKKSTQPAYVHWTSSTNATLAYGTTNLYELTETDTEFEAWHTEEVKSSYMSVFQGDVFADTTTVNIRIQIKSW